MYTHKDAHNKRDAGYTRTHKDVVSMRGLWAFVKVICVSVFFSFCIPGVVPESRCQEDTETHTPCGVVLATSGCPQSGPRSNVLQSTPHLLLISSELYATELRPLLASQHGPHRPATGRRGCGREAMGLSITHSSALLCNCMHALFRCSVCAQCSLRSMLMASGCSYGSAAGR